jgi:hypothetical protein
MNPAVAIHRLWREEREKPFAWGASDCLTWAADCALAVTGRDPAKDFRRRYTTRTGATRVRLKHGCRDMADVAAFFYRQIPAAQARSGDWAVVTNDDGTKTIGVVVASQIVARGLDGLEIGPIWAADSFYRVE